MNDTVYVWLEPTPKVTLTPLRDTICTDLVTSIGLTSVTVPTREVRFRYRVEFNSPEVELTHQADTNFLAPDFVIHDSIRNNSRVPQLVLFIVTPFTRDLNDNEKCPGIADTAYVWVAPELLLQDSVRTFIGGRNIRCFGENNGEIYILPSGGIEAFDNYGVYDLNYAWNTGKVTKDITGLTAGSYRVTVTDKLNCHAGDTVTLIQPDTMVSVIAIVDTISCGGGRDGTITVNSTGGTNGYSAAWYNFPEIYSTDTIWNKTLTNVLLGYYAVHITDTNGCENDIGRIVNEPSPLYVNLTPDNFSGYNIKCYGDNSGIIRPFAGTNQLLTYHWTGPNGLDTTYQTNQDLTPFDSLYAGNYNLILKDINNCHIMSSVELTQPEKLSASVVTHSMSCSGDRMGSAVITATGGAVVTGDYTYNWSNGATVDSASGLTPGIYYITLTDDNSCAVLDSATITQDKPITIDFNIVKAVSCYGYTDGILNAEANIGSPPYSYLWSDNSTGPTISGIGKGTYSLTVTDSKNCIESDTFSIEQPKELHVDFMMDPVSCTENADGEVSMSGSGGNGGYHYTFNSMPANGNSIGNLIAGLYQVKMQDQKNCQLDTFITVSQLDPIVIKTEVTTPACPDQTDGSIELTVSGGTPQYNFDWMGFSSVTGNKLNNIKEGNYPVEVTDARGCKATDTVEVVSDRRTCLDIPSAFTPNNDSWNNTWIINHSALMDIPISEIYPNLVVKVYNRWGKLVYVSGKGYPIPWDGRDMNGKALPVDSYYYIIQINDGSGRVETGNITIIR